MRGDNYVIGSRWDEVKKGPSNEPVAMGPFEM